MTVSATSTNGPIAAPALDFTVAPLAYVVSSHTVGSFAYVCTATLCTCPNHERATKNGEICKHRAEVATHQHANGDTYPDLPIALPMPYARKYAGENEEVKLVTPGSVVDFRDEADTRIEAAIVRDLVVSAFTGSVTLLVESTSGRLYAVEPTHIDHVYPNR
ncbi:hypothetical protein [Actinomadura yumaensis]|uniref:SWIM-type domain-containing protein n=1 Tax=Actinomadura yumaensis TaxID=111807 RepID=A0ABW2CSW7_9ACTN